MLRPRNLKQAIVLQQTAYSFQLTTEVLKLLQVSIPVAGVLISRIRIKVVLRCFKDELVPVSVR